MIVQFVPHPARLASRIAFVGSATPASAINGNDATISLANLVDTTGAAATLQQDDIVIVAYATSRVSDQAMAMVSAGWTEVTQLYEGASTTYDTNLAAYYKVMGATPDTDAVVDGSGSSSDATVAVAFAFRGVNTTTPLDVAPVTAVGSGTTRPNGGAITPATAGALIAVIGAGSISIGAAYTNPGDLSGETNHFQSANIAESNDIAIGMGIKTDWASGPFDPAQWGGGSATSGSWAAITLALRPS